jgi:two-component system OmpR family response regulator
MQDNVLIVDDNLDIRGFVKASLEVEGYRVTEAIDGISAMSIFNSESPSLVILDIGIGQPDGFEVCRMIRKISSTPIIMLTTRGDEVDEAMCLAAGADDYITKPVSPRILALRVTNQLRKRVAPQEKAATELRAGDLVLDVVSHELRVNSTLVPLTRTEFEFVHLLIDQPKRVFTREQVLAAIGGSADFSSDHLLDTHASRIRLKIQAAGGPRVISAVRAVGYRLFYPDTAPAEI